jgi:hypothetical protein
MKTESFEATAESGRGVKFESPVTYSGDYSVYEKADEVRAANDWPSDDDIVEYRNTQRKLAARNKALNAKLDELGIEKQTINNSESMRLAGMVRILMASGVSQEEATATAKATLKIA